MKKMTSLLLVLIMFLSVTLLFGCTGSQETKTRTIVDMAGRTVTVPEKVTSYVDIWFSHQSIPAMLDKCESMAATSFTRDNPFCAWFFEAFPNAVEADIEKMNAEELLENGVQVVFMQYSQKQELAVQLGELGIAAVAVDFTDFEGLKQSVSLVADVLNTDSAREVAVQFNNELDAQLEFLAERLANLEDSEKPRVLNLRSFEQLRADGVNTVQDAWIKACGGVNVCGEKGETGSSVYLNQEQVIEWNPDIIFTSNVGEAAEALVNPIYSGLKAVENSAIYDNPSGIHYWNRYTPEVLIQLKWASKILHPEIFEDVDINQNIKDYYLKYYNYEIGEKNLEQMLKGLPPLGWEE